MSDTNDDAALAHELSELKVQNRLLSREILSLTDGHKNVLKTMVSCQGLLHEFSKIEVRRDFITGKISVADNSDEILRSLDLIRDIVLPSPRASKGKVIDNDDAVVFISRLLANDAGEPLSGGLAMPFRQTFAYWRKYFSTLSMSTYWLSAPSEMKKGECTSFSKVGRSAEKCTRGYASELGDGVLNKASPPRKHRKTTVLSASDDSDDTSTEDSLTNDSSSELTAESSPDRSHRGQRHRKAGTKNMKGQDGLVRALQKLRVPKEVVSPGIFDPLQGRSLKSFLTDYERYFNAKYDGTDRDRSRQLGSLLDGHMKRTYDALGGPRMKYKDLKRELLQLHAAERTSKKDTSYSKFQHAKMQPLDSLRVYSMRLEQLALLAFPEKSERERQLRRKFKETVPHSFLVKLEGTLSTLSVFGERKVTWDQMKKVAEAADRSSKDKTTSGFSAQMEPTDESAIWYTQPSNVNFYPKGNRDHNIVTPQREMYERGGARPRMPQRPPEFHSKDEDFAQRAFGSGVDVTPGKPWCDWCGRRGHTERYCWQKQGACGRCGSAEHDSTRCTSYGPNEPVGAPTCSLCRGRHLGKDCPSLAKKQTKSSDKQPINY